jgi:hypothetical protein
MPRLRGASTPGVDSSERSVTTPTLPGLDRPAETDGLAPELAEVVRALESTKSLSQVSRLAARLGALTKSAAALEARCAELSKDRDEWRAAHGVLLNSIVPALGEIKKRSFASALASAPAVSTATTVASQGLSFRAAKPRPMVRVVPTGEGFKSSDDTLRALKSGVDPRKIGGIVGIRKGRDSSLLIMAATDEAAKRLADLPELGKVGLSVSVPQPRLPRVIVYDVPRESVDAVDRLIYEQCSQSPSVAFEEFKKTCRTSHRAGPQTGPCHVIMYVTPEIRAALLSKGRLYVDWQSCRVKDFVGVTLCRKCCTYGHPEKYCREKDLTCLHCGASGHTKSACMARELPGKCATCARYGRPASGHATGDTCCPAREAAVTREVARTAFV